jgi:GNAT superfamily N-acetyltransferase
MNLINLTRDFDFLELNPNFPIAGFDCGDSDLNDFFNNKSLLFQRERLGQTYYFCFFETEKVICAFTLSADSLKTVLLPGSRIKKIKELIPREKSLQTYPAFLIGRMGVSVDFSGKGIGTQLMDFIKIFCDSHFPNLARFLVVDAYNNDSVLSFYQKNGFSFVFSSEHQEKENIKKKIADDEALYTRQMFFDLIHLKE